MKKEIAEAWATALESGDYVQCRGIMVDGCDESGTPRMCAKGVLYDVHQKQCCQFTHEAMRFGGMHIREWAGTEDTSLALKDDNGNWRTVTYLNDVDGLHFKTLADMIREQQEEI
jgi:hypothetical protein